jgi:hypothetical protein
MRRIPSVPSEGDRAPRDCARASPIDRFRETIRDNEARLSQNEASPDVGTPRTQPMDGLMRTVEYFETLLSDERIRPHMIHELDSDIIRLRPVTAPDLRRPNIEGTPVPVQNDSMVRSDRNCADRS